MRISNVVRFVEDKSIVAARGIGRAAADFNHAVKAEYAKRREQRIIEQAEILARAQMIASKKVLAELEAQDAAFEEANT